ncbi:MAG: VanW family protein [Clostridia bacterium]|nr:VanW family protein [Clostridia bacterium]
MKRLHKNAIIFLTILICSLCFLCNGASAYGSGIKDIYVRLVYQDKVWQYRYPQIKHCGKIDECIDQCFEKDYRGRILRQSKQFRCSYRLESAEKILQQIAQQIDYEPICAKISFYPDKKNKFDIIKDEKGKKVNCPALIKEIEQNLSKGKSADIVIKPQIIEAEITEKSLKKALGIRAEFSTDFSASQPQRKHNIALALSCFNGMIIPPLQEISFNGTVGPRTMERGYKISKIISEGDFVEGYGGGVCQASTTLYNALLLSDIKIKEYHKHSLAVSYVPPSFDAMVNINTADLKFVNSSGNYLFIKTWTDSKRVYVRIYGEKLNYTIKRKSTILKTYPTPREMEITDTECKFKNLYEGEKLIIYSKPKIESKGELIYYDGGGNIIKICRLRKDVYAEFVGKIITGKQKKHIPQK